MKTSALRIGLIGSGDESSEKLLRLLTEQGMQIVHALKPGELTERLLTATNLDVWLLDLDDSQWHDQLDALMDRSSVPIFFNEHQSIEGQQHLDYWARNLINRMFELVGETPMAAPAMVPAASVASTPVATAPERKSERLPEQRPSDALTAMPAGLDPELLEEIAELEQLLQTSNQVPLEEIDDLAVTLREPTPAAPVVKPAEAEKPIAKPVAAAPAPATTAASTTAPATSGPAIAGAANKTATTSTSTAGIKTPPSSPAASTQPQPTPASKSPAPVTTAPVAPVPVATAPITTAATPVAKPVVPDAVISATTAARTAPVVKPEQHGNLEHVVKAEPIVDTAPVAKETPATARTSVTATTPVPAATPVTATTPVTTTASNTNAGAEAPAARVMAAAPPAVSESTAKPATVATTTEAQANPTVAASTGTVPEPLTLDAAGEARLPERHDWPSFPAPKPLAAAETDAANPDFAPMRPQPATGPMRELARPSAVAPLTTPTVGTPVRSTSLGDEVGVPTLTEAPAGEFEREQEFEALSDDDVPTLNDAVSEDAVSEDDVTELEVPMLESVAEATEFEVVPETSPGLPCDLWVLGASLGGPAALKRFFTAIDQPLPISFLLVQHIDAHFLPVLGKILEQANAFYNVQILARPGLIEPGALLLAPIERRLRFLDAGQIVLSGKTWSPPYAPCIDDVLLDVAAAYPGQVNSIIFSGMGADGVNGARAVQAAGGEIWLQEAGSCASSVMPDAIQNAGLSRYRATPEQLATRLMARYRPAISSKNLA